MAVSFELNAEVRADIGKGASRRLRRIEDKVPAVIYGAGKEAQSLTLEHDKVFHALKNEAFYSHILKINVNGKVESVILKDLQRHPSKPRILHMDFLRINANEKLHMHVPLHFEGEKDAPGVKTSGGIISHLMTELEVACLPADLPEFIAIDVSKLELNQTLHVSDLVLPKGVTVLHAKEREQLPVISIHEPRVVEIDANAPISADVPATSQKTPAEVQAAEAKKK